MPSAAEPELSELVRAVGAGGSFTTTPSFTEEEQEDAAAAAEVELELARCDEALVEASRALELGNTLLQELTLSLSLPNDRELSVELEHSYSDSSSSSSWRESPPTCTPPQSPTARYAAELEEAHFGSLRPTPGARLNKRSKKRARDRIHHRDHKRKSDDQVLREAKRAAAALADKERQEEWQTLRGWPALNAVVPTARGVRPAPERWERLPSGWQQPRRQQRQQQRQQRRQQQAQAGVSAEALGVDAATARLLAELQYRDITPEDYATLGVLDENIAKPTLDESEVQALPELVRQTPSLTHVMLQMTILSRQARDKYWKRGGKRGVFCRSSP